MTTTLRDRFSARRELLVPLAAKLEAHVSSCLSHCVRIDRIAARAKALDRFLEKAARTTPSGLAKYDDPLAQIQDQVGARVVTFYPSDVDAVSSEVERYFRPIERRDVLPESDAEFGYFGKHYVLFLPEDVMSDELREHDVRFFELQVKTLFQHAWSEANHDLGYKPASELTSDQKRKIAFTSAQAWGADRIFDELHLDLSRK